MSENYYDNRIIEADENEKVFIDRIYCFDFPIFEV